jgi:putative pyruvate formate lyase activating enzyme
MATRDGFCRLGAAAPCYKALLSYGEEAVISPTALLDLGGCSLRCLGCTEWDHVVEPWRAPAVALDARWLAPRLTEWIGRGARTISIVGGEPSMHLLAVAETLAALPPPLQLPLVWNTNGLLSDQARALLLDWVDCWVIDLKVADDESARRMLGSGPVAYVAEVERTIDAVAALPDTGAALPDAGATSADDALPRLLIRHLLVPGEIERTTLPLLERYAARWPNALWNVMTGWLPHGPALRHEAGPSALRRILSPVERDAACAAAAHHLGERLLIDGRRAQAAAVS